MQAPCARTWAPFRLAVPATTSTARLPCSLRFLSSTTRRRRPCLSSAGPPTDSPLPAAPLSPTLHHHHPQTRTRPATGPPRLARHASSARWKQRQDQDPYVREARVRGLKSRAAFKLIELDAKYRLFRRGRGQVVVDLGFAPGSWSQVAVDRTAPDGRVVGIDVIPAQPPRGVSTIQGNFLSPGVREMVKQFLLDGERRRRAMLAERRRMKKEGGGGAVVGVGEVAGDGDEVADRPSYIDMERMAAIESEAAAPDPDPDPDQSSSSSSSSDSDADDDPAGEEEEEGDKQEEDEEEEEEAEGAKPNLRLVDVVLSDMMMNTSGIAFKDHAGSMDLCRAALMFASDTLKPGGHFVCKFYQGAEDKQFENLLKKMFARVHREKPDSSRSGSREAFFVALKRKGDVTLEDIDNP